MSETEKKELLNDLIKFWMNAFPLISYEKAQKLATKQFNQIVEELCL